MRTQKMRRADSSSINRSSTILYSQPSRAPDRPASLEEPADLGEGFVDELTAGTRPRWVSRKGAFLFPLCWDGYAPRLRVRAARHLAHRDRPGTSAEPEAGRAGHFAAWEEPALFTSELRAAFSPCGSRPPAGEHAESHCIGEELRPHLGGREG
jgi:hypothetical protein